MIKAEYINNILFFLFIVLFSSCGDLDPSYVNIYPSNIDIPGIGTLKYTNTIWDGKNDGRKNEIDSAIEVDNEIWVLATDYGSYVNKGLKKSNTIRLRDDYYRWDSIMEKLLHKGDYVFLFSHPAGYYDPDYKKDYYITRIHKESLKLEYFYTFTLNIFDNIFMYYDKDDVFLVLYDSAYQPEFIYSVNNNCNALDERSEEEFINFCSQNPNVIQTENGSFLQIDPVIRDGNGRLYRIISGEFEVSVDDGITWYKSSMGTNSPRDIIVQNNNIYVFCYPDSRWVSSWGTKSVGGGIHVFQWK